MAENENNVMSENEVDNQPAVEEEAQQNQDVQDKQDQKAKDKAEKHKHWVNPVIAWTCIGLAAAIVLFVGLFVARTLV